MRRCADERGSGGVLADCRSYFISVVRTLEDIVEQELREFARSGAGAVGHGAEQKSRRSRRGGKKTPGNRR